MRTLLAGLLPRRPVLSSRDHPLAFPEEMPIESRRLFTDLPVFLPRSWRGIAAGV